jgi:hypothetical protein
MSDNTASASSGGFGLSGAVFIVFLVLKLTDTEPVSNWGWIWIFSPLWIPWVILIGIGLIVLVVWGIFKLFQTEQDRKNSAARKALDNLSKSYRR